MNEQKSIDKTKRSFETSFAEAGFYNRQTQDDEHLKKIIEGLDKGGSILDLGTGNGYLAFPLAAQNPEVRVVGLDIVEETLKRNAQKAEELQLFNLSFVNYDGVTFPFPDQSFTTVVTRYALHHFPTIKKTFQEISRVLEPGGQLFLSDPTPNDNDANRFVDDYMQVKDDGHIQFYSLAEFEKLAKDAGLLLQNSFITEIRFPRKMSAAYSRILAKESEDTLKSYAVEIIKDEIYITEKVLNLYFRK